METAPEAAGRILRGGATQPPSAESSLLVGDDGQCFVRAPRSGLWWTFRDIGETLEAGAVVGLCAGRQVPTPVAGFLSGLVRRGTQMRAGMRLLEVDPRPDDERCGGISPLAAAIAAATVRAVHELWQMPRQDCGMRWLMAHVTFWGKPGCAGNAKQMALLRASGHELEVRDLSAEPWTAQRLRPFFGDTPSSVVQHLRAQGQARRDAAGDADRSGRDGAAAGGAVADPASADGNAVKHRQQVSMST